MSYEGSCSQRRKQRGRGHGDAEDGQGSVGTGRIRRLGGGAKEIRDLAGFGASQWLPSSSSCKKKQRKRHESSGRERLEHMSEMNERGARGWPEWSSEELRWACWSQGGRDPAAAPPESGGARIRATRAWDRGPKWRTALGSSTRPWLPLRDAAGPEISEEGA